MKYECTRGFYMALKKTLNLHLTYFRNAIFCFTSNNKKALIPLRIRAFPNFAFFEKRCVRDSNP